MKKLLLLSVLFLLALSCVPAFADDLADARKTGELRFGSAPDYIPFVFYDRTGTLTGIDIALINEVGRRMGLTITTVDIAFDGLIDALNLGQVDVIGGAFSRTDARRQLIDFTRVYYYGDAEFIGLASLQKPETVDYSSFRDLKIGVQKGTSFDQWVKSNLVSGGYVSTRNVFIYPSAAAEMKALDRGDVDLVIMDHDLYDDVYKSSGKYRVFYNGFAREDYAFGLRKGSSLEAEISRHLTDMLHDGTAQEIANRFFSGNYQEADVSRSRSSQILTPLPAAQATQEPAQSAGAEGPRIDYMSLESDIKITDGHHVQPGEHFRKTWRVKNTGTTTWTPKYSLVFVFGDQMNGKAINIPAAVVPGESADLSADLIAPYTDGNYRGYWQMQAPDGRNFGETIWVKIRVKRTGQSETATPSESRSSGSDPDTQGQSSTPIDILAFDPDYYAGYKGDCVNVSWNVTSASTIEVTVDGESIYLGNDMRRTEKLCGGPLLQGGAHRFQLHAFTASADAYASFNYTTY